MTIYWRVKQLGDYGKVWWGIDLCGADGEPDERFWDEVEELDLEAFEALSDHYDTHKNVKHAACLSGLPEWVKP